MKNMKNIKKFSEYVSDDFKGMTVRDLITILSEADPDSLVFIERHVHARRKTEFRAVNGGGAGRDIKIFNVVRAVGITTVDEDLEEYTGPAVVFTSWD
jgi:hypothetical protein